MFKCKKTLPLLSHISLLLLFVGTSQASAGSDKLGSLQFPTSGSPKAQKLFLRGVKLLHNFEYEEALEAFQRARKIQPNFAMAYWGEAMCHNHPLWGEQDLKAARKVLTKLKKLTSLKVTPREKGYLDAVKVLYSAGTKSQRDKDYEELMG